MKKTYGENMQPDEEERQTFAIKCGALHRLLDVIVFIEGAYSDREICAVLATKLKIIIEKQEDAKGAMEQVISTLREPMAKDGMDQV